MQKDKIDFINIIECLNSSNIKYIIGGESLTGLNEGNISKYTNSTTIYLFPHSLIDMLSLTIQLALRAMFVKPLKPKGVIKFNYKIRGKSLFKSIYRRKRFYFFPMVNYENKYKFYSGGRYVKILKSALENKMITTTEIEGINVSIPKNLNEFVEKHKSILLASKYKKYEISLINDFETRAINMLENVSSILNNHHIHYWLEGGTCLGAVRDKKLIPWDHDLDLGMKYTNDEEIINLIKTFKKYYEVEIRSFPKLKEVWDLGEYRLIKLRKKNKLFQKNEQICLDLFIFYKDMYKEAEVYKYVVWNKNGFHPSKYLDSPKIVSFYNIDFPVPNFVEEWLENKYGKNWKKPKKDWHVLMDDGTIIR